MKKQILILFLLLTVITGCGLFETRTPEPPGNEQSSFQPPYSANTVLSNFTNALNEKNVDNYLSCLSDTVQGDPKYFAFVPSQEALNYYPNQFVGWNLTNERRYFTSLMKSLTTDSSVKFILKNTSAFDVLSTDSAVITSDYFLSVPNTTGNATASGGTLQFVIYRRTTGWWTIQRWIDTKSSSDTSLKTWSVLKGQYN